MWFVTRHGQTMYNLKKIKQGRYSSLLTLKGIDQMKSVAYRMLDNEENFEDYKVIVSPMVRTRHSAQIIMEILGITDKKMIEDDLINEKDAGDCTNMEKKLIKEKYPYLEEEKKTLGWDFKLPNGESSNDVYKRVKEFYEIHKNEKNLIVVSHGTCVRCLCGLLAGKSKEEIGSASINQNYCFMYDGNEVVKI